MVVAGGTFFALAISRSYFEVGGLPNGLVGVIEPIALSVSILGLPLSHSVRAQYKRGFMRLWLGRGRLPMAQARDWETRAHPRRRRTAAQTRSFASCLRRRIPCARTSDLNTDNGMSPCVRRIRRTASKPRSSTEARAMPT